MTPDHDALPPTGGRWIRDPETGEVLPAPDAADTQAPQAPDDEE